MRLPELGRAGREGVLEVELLLVASEVVEPVARGFRPLLEVRLLVIGEGEPLRFSISASRFTCGICTKVSTSWKLASNESSGLLTSQRR